MEKLGTDKFAAIERKLREAAKRQGWQKLYHIQPDVDLPANCDCDDISEKPRDASNLPSNREVVNPHANEWREAVIIHATRDTNETDSKLDNRKTRRQQMDEREELIQSLVFDLSKEQPLLSELQLRDLAINQLKLVYAKRRELKANSNAIQNKISKRTAKLLNIKRDKATPKKRNDFVRLPKLGTTPSVKASGSVRVWQKTGNHSSKPYRFNSN